MKALFKFVALVAFLVIGGGLLVYAASRSLDFVQTTLPSNDQALGYFALLAIEPKASNEMNDVIVLAKRDATVTWCQRVTAHSVENNRKPWKYVLIPHDAIAENMTLDGLVAQYTVKP